MQELYTRIALCENDIKRNKDSNSEDHSEIKDTLAEHGKRLLKIERLGLAMLILLILMQAHFIPDLQGLIQDTIKVVGDIGRMIV